MRATNYFLIGLAIGIGLIFLMIILASSANMGQYYLKPSNGNLEVWRGKFAPLGEEKYVVLAGAKAPKKIKAFYDKEEVLPLIFNHFIMKADARIETAGIPDFGKIKDDLNTALAYATTDSAKNLVYSRLNNINLMLLIYKADVAASKKTMAALKSALGLLEEAALLDIDEGQSKLIENRIVSIQKQMAALKQKKNPKTAPQKATK